LDLHPVPIGSYPYAGKIPRVPGHDFGETTMKFLEAQKNHLLGR
jgi:hypothetical protein